MEKGSEKRQNFTSGKNYYAFLSSDEYSYKSTYLWNWVLLKFQGSGIGPTAETCSKVLKKISCWQLF